MKKYILFLGVFTGIAACEEIGPDIDFTPPDLTLIDTTYVELTPETPADKVVLLEDFTGVQCVNCPGAHEEITEILGLYPGRVVTVAEHNYFAGPFSDSNEDYEIPEALELDDYLGPAPAWPAGFVDRKDFGTGVLYTLIVSNYKIYVEEQLLETAPCNVYIEPSYDSETRKAKVKVIVKYTTAVAEENHLSIMITENGIIDLQLALTGIDETYEHNHVLRDMFTPATGVNLDAEKIAGRVFEREFVLDIPEHWNTSELEITAFVHNFTTENKEVLQAAKVPLL